MYHAYRNNFMGDFKNYDIDHTSIQLCDYLTNQLERYKNSSLAFIHMLTIASIKNKLNHTIATNKKNEGVSFNDEDTFNFIRYPDIKEVTV